MVPDYTLLDAQPSLALQVQQHVEWPQDATSQALFEDGVSLPQDDHGLMLFQDVDSHVDGFGWAVLMLVQGSGEFQIVRQGVLHRIALEPGSVVAFDNRDEHGFMPIEEGMRCAGVALEVGQDHLIRPASSLEALHKVCARHYGPSSPAAVAKSIVSLKSYLHSCAALEAEGLDLRLQALDFLAKVVEQFSKRDDLVALQFMRNQDPRLKLSWGRGSDTQVQWESPSQFDNTSLGLSGSIFMDQSFPSPPTVERCREILDTLVVPVPTSASKGIHRDRLRESVEEAAGPYRSAWIADTRAAELEQVFPIVSVGTRGPRM